VNPHPSRVVSAAACAPALGTYEYDRTLLCWKTAATVSVLLNKVRLGTVTFDVAQEIQLNVAAAPSASR
jgi:hypothetical protein